MLRRIQRGGEIRLRGAGDEGEGYAFETFVHLSAPVEGPGVALMHL
ncbi:hypothetical protein GO499_00905 [Algicella marina]|uniref:Uncharacterized protein n=1 Tax=Algicella marina TaxID=2683284 RepID=A0A6P1SVQ3_9RHOB|nr:hypothetical protein GO499_00905 [Algicella marina]